LYTGKLFVSGIFCFTSTAYITLLLLFFFGMQDVFVPHLLFQDLFSEVGKLRQAFVKFDKNGRSTGSAEVVFNDRASALEAIKRYNGVPLDGKPMKLSLVTKRGSRSSRRTSNMTNNSTSGDYGGRRIIIT